MAKVRIPPTLRAEVGGVREVEASGATMRERARRPGRPLPGLGAQVLSNGDIAPFVNVYLNNEDVRTLEGLDTPVADGSTVILLPAMAGGQIPTERSNHRRRRERPRPRRLDAAGRALPAHPSPTVKLYAKLEGQNPTGSIKDRVAKTMIETAEAAGELVPGRELLEPTSGNTGISLAMVAKLKGYSLTCVMPGELDAGAHPAPRAVRSDGRLLAPAAEGSNGAVRLALAWPSGIPALLHAVPVRERGEPAGALRGHRSAEIAEALPRVDAFVAGPRTGGTLMGCSERLRESFPDVQIIAAEPLQGDAVMGLRSLEDGYTPPILDVSRLDRKILVSNKDAVRGVRLLLDEEGIFAGVSCGAAIHVAQQIASELVEGVVVTVLADGGWKYLSADFWTQPLEDVERSMEDRVWW